MLGQHLIDDMGVQLKRLRDNADKAIAQVSSDQLFATIDPDANSIAIIMKHVAGNMRSRWTNFLTSDGEKPDRNRDGEFEAEGRDTRESLLASWEQAWALTLQTVGALQPSDLEKTVTIRGQALTVVQALNRQLAHYSEHVGQIVLLAKHYAGSRWQTLSIPKRKSAS